MTENWSDCVISTPLPSDCASHLYTKFVCRWRHLQLTFVKLLLEPAACTPLFSISNRLFQVRNSLLWWLSKVGCNWGSERRFCMVEVFQLQNVCVDACTPFWQASVTNCFMWTTLLDPKTCDSIVFLGWFCWGLLCADQDQDSWRHTHAWTEQANSRLDDEHEYIDANVLSAAAASHPVCSCKA